MAGIVFSEGSGLQDSIYGKYQGPVRLFIEKHGKSCEAQSILPEIFHMEKSKHYGEKFTTMTGMNGFQAVGEGGTYPVDSMQEGYSKFLTHVTWKNSFILTREIIDDSIMMDLTSRPEEFVAGYYETREKLGAAILGGATKSLTKIKFAGTTFDITSADGQALFSKEHPAKIKGKKQSNMFADAFSADALAAAECAMQNFRGENEDVLDVAPNTIVIPNDYQLKKDVFAVIGADKDPASAGNGFNFLFGRWRVIVWNYLNQFIAEGSKPWILLDKQYNDRKAGAIWLDRTPLEVKSVIDEATDNNKWKGYARFNATFNDWRAFSCGGLAGGTQLIGG